MLTDKTRRQIREQFDPGTPDVGGDLGSRLIASGMLHPDTAARLEATGQLGIKQDPSQAYEPPPPPSLGYGVEMDKPPPQQDLSQLLAQQPAPSAGGPSPTAELDRLGRETARAGRSFQGELAKTEQKYGEQAGKAAGSLVRQADIQVQRNEAQTAAELDLLRQEKLRDAFDENERQEERRSVDRAAYELRSLEAEANNYKIDPERKMRPLGNKILAALAVGFGELGASISGRGGNMAAQIVRASIDDDIAAQQSELDGKRRAAGAKSNELQLMRQRFGDDELGRQALRAKHLAYAEKEIEAAMSKYDNAGLRERAAQTLAEVQAEIAKTSGEFVERRANLDAQNRQQRIALAGEKAETQTAMAKAAGAAAPSAIGQWVGNAPTKEANNEAMEMAGAGEAVLGQFSSLNQLLDDVGTEVFPTAKAAEAQSMADALRIEVGKNLFKLGVLSDKDLEMLNNVIPKDPTAFRQAVVRGKLKQAETYVRTKMAAYMKARGYRQQVNETDPTRGQ
jgi:hypothetical protein